MNVFFLCSWYPNKNHTSDGIFLKNMAEAIARYEQIAVFYIGVDAALPGGTSEIRTQEHGVDTIILYHKPINTGVKIIDTVLNSVKEIFLMHKLVRREFKKCRPDIIHLNVVTPKMLIPWYYKFFYRIPFVYSEHWDIPIRVRFGLMSKWLQWRIGMKLASMFTSRVIVCSEAMRSAFGHFGLSHDIDIISNVVDIQETNFEDENRLAGKKVLLHISSLDTAQKNVYGMIDAIAQVAASRSDFELHVLGRGKELQALKDYASSLGLLDHVIYFHGYVSEEEKHNWIKKSIAHVIFSNFEGQSVVTGESLRYGRPVIATRCGGPEDFVNESNGILVAPRDINGLATVVNDMLDNYQHFSPDQIRRDSARIFSPEVVGQQHADLYKAILRQ